MPMGADLLRRHVGSAARALSDAPRAYDPSMNLIRKVRGRFRRRPLTSEDLAARQEAELIRDQMLKDRASQTGYRPGSR